MIYNLLSPFSEGFILFNLFRYVTFRSGAACMTALFISLFFGNAMIRWLRSFQNGGQPIRTDGPQGHLVKKGTPTMGGVLMLAALVPSTLLWADLRNGFVWATLLVTLAYGALGFWDDWLKVTKRNTKGVSGKMKLVVQGGVGLVAAIWITSLLPGAMAYKLGIPFTKDIMLNFGMLVFPLVATLVMMGASNAVNLTDGLDGLATVPVLLAAAVFALIAYLVGNRIFADYLQLNGVPGTAELAVFLAALIGAGLGFLWFNAPPAAVFMGDTGSLALGGALGAVAVATKHEIVLAIVGGLFVVETVSVMIQVFWYKRTGRRVFLMAPLHHHFEKKGWAEPTIVIRFWIIAMILALVGLSTLKIR